MTVEPDFHSFGFDFLNEHGTKIRIDVSRDSGKGEVSIRVLGPDTESTWLLTEREAKKLRYAIGRIFE